MDFFALLSRLIPRQIEVIILLDRGFKRVSLLRHLEDCGLHYVIRSGGNTRIKHSSYEGAMEDLIVKKGSLIDLPQAGIRKFQSHQSRVVAAWDHEQQEPWILVTDLKERARGVIRWYGKRFQIEEMFRDQKSHRFGWGLGNLQMYQADRLECLLLIIDFTQFIVLMVGA